MAQLQAQLDLSRGIRRSPDGGDFMNHSDLLVVDDDDATRTGLRQLLANEGFTVDVARDGAEAMEKIGSHDFRVVLLDVRRRADLQRATERSGVCQIP
jgi:PleD family two-component response regulator